jgi:hypothetical protein
MGNKTRLEKELAAYGQFQSTIRNMSRDQREQYAEPGTPEHARHAARLKAYQERYAERKQLIAAFDKEEPKFGSFAGLTTEQVNRITEIQLEWRRKRARFMEDLDKRLPALDV